MRSYKIIVSDEAIHNLDDIVAYISSIYRLEAGVKYKDRVLASIKCLLYSADCFPISKSRVLKRIHPNARRLIIMNKKWNVVFHISGKFVVIDRLIPSKNIKS